MDWVLRKTRTDPRRVQRNARDHGHSKPTRPSATSRTRRWLAALYSRQGCNA